MHVCIKAEFLGAKESKEIEMSNMVWFIGMVFRQLDILVLSFAVFLCVWIHRHMILEERKEKKI